MIQKKIRYYFLLRNIKQIWLSNINKSVIITHMNNHVISYPSAPLYKESQPDGSQVNVVRKPKPNFNELGYRATPAMNCVASVNRIRPN